MAKKWTPDRVAKAQRLAKEGKGTVEIARILGVSRRTVYRWVHGERRKDYQKATDKRLKPTDEGVWRKRTPERMEAASRLRDAGLGWDKIGEALGVAGNTVRSWIDDDYKRRKREAQDRYRAKNVDRVREYDRGRKNAS